MAFDFLDVQLPPDCQYVLDGALENGDITAFHHSALHLLGDSGKIKAIIDKPRPSRSWRRSVLPMAMELAVHAEDVALAMPAEVQRALMASALLREPSVVHGYGRILAEWFFSDSIWGGNLLEYRRRPRCDTYIIPQRRITGRVFSPKICRQYVKKTGEILPFSREQRTRLSAMAWPESLDEAEQLNDFFAQQRARWNVARETRFQELIERHRVPDLITRPKRKVMMRSIRAARSIVGDDVVREFCAGRPVYIEAKSYVFQIERRGSLTSQGHAGMGVKLLDRERRILSSMCIYFDNTPVLDQLGAIALFAASDEVEELINRANHSAVTELGFADPLVSKRMAIGGLDEIRPPWIPGENIPPVLRTGDMARRRGRIQDRQWLENDHYRQMEPVFREAIYRRLWGRQYNRVMAFVSKINNAQHPWPY